MTDIKTATYIDKLDKLVAARADDAAIAAASTTHLVRPIGTYTVCGIRVGGPSKGWFKATLVGKGVTVADVKVTCGRCAVTV